MATSQTNHVLVTDDDHGPILAVVTWFLMTVMILAVLARVTIKLVIRRAVGVEDYLIVAALAFGIAQSIAVSIGIQDGLGKREASLGPANLNNIDQAQYAASLLYILTAALAKLSVIQLLRALTVKKLHRTVTKVTTYVAIAWAIPSFFILAFQCGASQPWAARSGHCIDRFTFWAAIAPLDILTEIVVVGLPIWMMVPVQVAVGKKVVVVVAFIFRFAVIIITIIRLILLKSYFSSSDMIFDSVDSGIASQCLVSMSILTACIPSLKPFLDGFESGMLGVSFKPQGGTFNGNSYEMSSSNGGGRSARPRNPDVKDNTGAYLAAISSQRSRNSPGETGSVDSGKSDAMIIKRTDQWDIRYETSHAPSLEPRKEVQDAV